MASTRERVEIDEHIFFVKRIPPLRALPILGDLQKLFVAPLSKLDTTDLMDVSASIDSSMDSILAAVAEFSTTLSGDVLDKWRRILLDPNCISLVVDDPHMPEQLTEKLIDERLEVSVVLELMVRVALINFKTVFTKASSRVGEALKSKGQSRLASSATG